jgi:hypothetical protein
METKAVAEKREKITKKRKEGKAKPTERTHGGTASNAEGSASDDNDDDPFSSVRAVEWPARRARMSGRRNRRGEKRGTYESGSSGPFILTIGTPFSTSTPSESRSSSPFALNPAAFSPFRSPFSTSPTSAPPSAPSPRSAVLSSAGVRVASLDMLAESSCGDIEEC